MNGQGTDQTQSLSRGFLILRFFFIYIFTITGARNIVRYTEEFVMYRFVKSQFHSTALALKSQDMKYCGSELYFVILQCTIVREAYFIILFYCMAKGPLLVACK